MNRIFGDRNGFGTMRTHRRSESLGNDQFNRTGHQIRVQAHVDESNKTFDHAVGVEVLNTKCPVIAALTAIQRLLSRASHHEHNVGV